MTSILSVRNLSKTFNNGNRKLTVLSDISLDFQRGVTCAVVGPSGSGKTTLLGLCAGLDNPSSGQVVFNGANFNTLDEDARAQVRNRMIGFVFQNFQLISTLTALENVMVPLELRGEKLANQRAGKILDEVGLSARTHHYPIQLSGGEQQRVALARAFINQPKILFADEPTGNLDSETSGRVEDLLFEMNRANGTTLIIATHNPELAGRTERIIRLKGGRLE